MNPLVYSKLAFPLNVYAYAMSLQQGHVESLHYGLVAENEDPWDVGAAVAQQRATDLLLNQLPPPPGRVLEIGVGLGKTATLLSTRGYDVTAISPDPQQIALATTQLAGKGQLQCVTFEAFTAPTQSYDIILLQESAQYLKALPLFNKSHELLNENGQLILADEVSLRRTPQDGTLSLPRLKYTLNQAARCGFNCVIHVDLSKQAAPTLDYLLKAIEIHRTKLLADLALSAPELDQLTESLKLYRQKYHDGRYGYVLLHFKKVKTPRWLLTEVTAADYPAVKTLFNEAFNQELHHDVWHWKYGDGRGLATAAWREGKMVAHYGGVIRELQYFGTPKKGVQIVDVMVSIKERGVLTRRGPYFLVGATFPECYAGYGAPILLGFGFPTRRAIETAERLGLYAEVGKMVEIHWPTAAGRPLLGSRIRHLQGVDNTLIETVWTQMAADFTGAILGVRNAAYLRHRYVTHPQKRYELLLVTHRFFLYPLGILVFQRNEVTKICQLLEIIAPLKQFPVLLKQARRMAGNWGFKTLTFWITENFASIFTQWQGDVQPLDIRIPHCIWYEGPPTEEVNEKWWLTGGDTDFL